VELINKQSLKVKKKSLYKIEREEGKNRLDTLLPPPP
jgi:hypothetical protein